MQAGGRRFDPVRLHGLGCRVGACCHGEDARSDAKCWTTAVGRGSAFGVCDALAGHAGEGVETGSLLIVNQVLVRFGRAGRLGGFLLDRASGWARAGGGGP